MASGSSSTAPREATKGTPPLSVDASTRAADILWVYLHLDDPGVTRQATAAGRWNLLQWARAERARFYRYVLPKAIGKKKATPPPAPKYERPGSIEEIDASLREVLKPRHRKAYDATHELVAEVLAMLTDWSAQWQLQAPEACLEELSYSLAGWISTATQDDAIWVDEEVFT